MEKSYKLIFIIAHKYYRQYPSYIKLYINNIDLYYPNSLIIIVDNNSKYIKDIQLQLCNNTNVTIIINNTPAKYEIGAYSFGIKYLLDNNLIPIESLKYIYIVFTQDTMVLNKKYNFNTLINNNIYAATIWSKKQSMKNESLINFEPHTNTLEKILGKFNLYNKLDECSFCWCHSYVINASKINDLYYIIKDIIHINRWDSIAGERYMSRILYELNNKNNFSICGDNLDFPEKDYYICANDGTLEQIMTTSQCYFIKHAQCKTHETPDI